MARGLTLFPTQLTSLHLAYSRSGEKLLTASAGDSARDKRDYAILPLLLGCGLRRAELTGKFGSRARNIHRQNLPLGSKALRKPFLAYPFPESLTTHGDLGTDRFALAYQFIQ